MIKSGEMRIFAANFLSKLVREDVVQKDDIRWLKDKNGTFPVKLIWAGDPGAPSSIFTEVPYTINDTFVLFDVVESMNIASERINNKVTSQLPFRIIVNVYGSNSPDEVQYMLSNIHSFGIRNWLSANKVVITTVPTEIVVLDGRENAQFWIRRRIVLDMATTQTYENYDNVDEYRINKVTVTEIKNIGEK